MQGAVLAAVSSAKFASFYNDPPLEGDDMLLFEEQDPTSSGITHWITLIVSFMNKMSMPCAGAVAHVLDSLEEVHALSDGAENDLEFLQSLLDDKSLHSMLEVWLRLNFNVSMISLSYYVVIVHHTTTLDGL